MTRSPEKTKLVLVDAPVTEPMKTHVHGFGLLGLYVTVDDTLSSTIGVGA